MTSHRVAVLGGGPAGLTAARLLRKAQPTWQVTVFERQAPQSTFGYGVGLGWSALRQLATADEGLVDQLRAASVSVDTWTIRRDQEALSATNTHGLGIARQSLLEILRRAAVAAGVELRSGQQVTLADVADADVVLAADGVGSQTREVLARELGASSVQGELAYLWCGAELSLPAMTLALARTPHGPLAAHVMPYSATSSTFQVDGHHETIAAWRSGEQDAGLRQLEQTYADLLGGSPLRAKRPSWQCFETVSCERWSSGNVVLLGDAAHTAHYTVGSGTGLAVEDAVALVEALCGEAGIAEAFASYEAARQPRVRKVQERAARSQTWWTSLGMRIDDPLSLLLLSYLTRTGAVPLLGLVETNRDLLEGAWPGLVLTDSPADDVLSTPYGARPGRVVSALELTGAEVSTVVVDKQPDITGIRLEVERTLDLAARGTTTVRLLGPDRPDALLDRLELSEHLRRAAGVTTVVAGPTAQRDSLAVGVLAGRTDLVEFS